MDVDISICNKSFRKNQTPINSIMSSKRARLPKPKIWRLSRRARANVLTKAAVRYRDARSIYWSSVKFPLLVKPLSTTLSRNVDNCVVSDEEKIDESNGLEISRNLDQVHLKICAERRRFWCTIFSRKIFVCTLVIVILLSVPRKFWANDSDTRMYDLNKN